MQRRTPKDKPLEAKAKAHQRAAARAKKQTAEALRDKLNGSATIGRINSNTRKIQAMLKPEYYVSKYQAMEGKEEMDALAMQAVLSNELHILQTLIRNDFTRLKYLLPTLRSVDINAKGDFNIEVGIVKFSDVDDSATQ